MPEKRLNATQTLEAMCPRCQEREAAPDPKQPLANPKYESFAVNVAVKKMTNSDAYRSAGYGGKNKSGIAQRAHTIRRRIDVQNRIMHLQELTLEHDLKTQEWVDDGLRQVYERCMDIIPVPNESGKWKFNSQGANAALLTMARARGMLVEKIELTGIEKELKDMKPEEIVDFIKAAILGLTNARDFIKQLGEESGLEFADSESGSATEVPPGDAIPTLQ
jgi:hypothetical protein